VDDGDGSSPSPPATERHERDEEAAVDAETRTSGTRSLPETERRTREQEAREDWLAGIRPPLSGLVEA
jgi:hypothetical protein